MDDVVFLSQLNKYPALRKRMEEILNVAGDLTERLDLADDAEGALIENIMELVFPILHLVKLRKLMQFKYS